MRKNAVSQQLIPLDGGITAVDGFSCSDAVLSCPQMLFTEQFSERLTIISSSARCVSACVFPAPTMPDMHTQWSMKQAKNANVKALLLSESEKMDVQPLSETQVKADFRCMADVLGCEMKSVCAVNIGKVGSAFSAVSKQRLQTLQSAGNSQNVWQQCAYAFCLGDIVCRVGAIFIGGDEHSRQTGAQSTVCCLTTDVNISPQMLEKAFISAVEDAFYPLYLGVDRSPNDFYAILSSCNAGNYIISETDSEYKKFYTALKRMLEEIVLRITKNDAKKRLLCLVNGAKSKQTAQALANAFSLSEHVRKQARLKDFHVETLLCALANAGERVDIKRLQIYVRGENGEIALFDYGKQTAVEQAAFAKLMGECDVHIEVRLHDGHYKASAIAKL